MTAQGSESNGEDGSHVVFLEEKGMDSPGQGDRSRKEGSRSRSSTKSRSSINGMSQSSSSRAISHSSNNSTTVSNGSSSSSNGAAGSSAKGVRNGSGSGSGGLAAVSSRSNSGRGEGSSSCSTAQSKGRDRGNSSSSSSSKVQAEGEGKEEEGEEEEEGSEGEEGGSDREAQNLSWLPVSKLEDAADCHDHGEGCKEKAKSSATPKVAAGKLLTGGGPVQGGVAAEAVKREDELECRRGTGEWEAREEEREAELDLLASEEQADVRGQKGDGMGAEALSGQRSGHTPQTKTGGEQGSSTRFEQQPMELSFREGSRTPEVESFSEPHQSWETRPEEPWVDLGDAQMQGEYPGEAQVPTELEAEGLGVPLQHLEGTLLEVEAVVGSGPQGKLDEYLASVDLVLAAIGVLQSGGGPSKELGATQSGSAASCCEANRDQVPVIGVQAPSEVAPVGTSLSYGMVSPMPPGLCPTREYQNWEEERSVLEAEHGVEAPRTNPEGRGRHTPGMQLASNSSSPASLEARALALLQTALGGLEGEFRGMLERRSAQALKRFNKESLESIFQRKIHGAEGAVLGEREAETPLLSTATPSLCIVEGNGGSIPTMPCSRFSAEVEGLMADATLDLSGLARQRSEPVSSSPRLHSAARLERRRSSLSQSSTGLDLQSRPHPDENLPMSPAPSIPSPSLPSLSSVPSPAPRNTALLPSSPSPAPTIAPATAPPTLELLPPSAVRWLNQTALCLARAEAAQGCLVVYRSVRSQSLSLSIASLNLRVLPRPKLSGMKWPALEKETKTWSKNAFLLSVVLLRMEWSCLAGVLRGLPSSQATLLGLLVQDSGLLEALSSLCSSLEGIVSRSPVLPEQLFSLLDCYSVLQEAMPQVEAGLKAAMMLDPETTFLSYPSPLDGSAAPSTRETGLAGMKGSFVVASPPPASPFPSPSPSLSPSLHPTHPPATSALGASSGRERAQTSKVKPFTEAGRGAPSNVGGGHSDEGRAGRGGVPRGRDRKKQEGKSSTHRSEEGEGGEGEDGSAFSDRARQVLGRFRALKPLVCRAVLRCFQALLSRLEDLPMALRSGPSAAGASNVPPPPASSSLPSASSTLSPSNKPKDQQGRDGLYGPTNCLPLWRSSLPKKPSPAAQAAESKRSQTTKGALRSGTNLGMSGQDSARGATPSSKDGSKANRRTKSLSSSPGTASSSSPSAPPTPVTKATPSLLSGAALSSSFLSRPPGRTGGKPPVSKSSSTGSTCKGTGAVDLAALYGLPVGGGVDPVVSYAANYMRSYMGTERGGRGGGGYLSMLLEVFAELEQVQQQQHGQGGKSPNGASATRRTRKQEGKKGNPHAGTLGTDAPPLSSDVGLVSVEGETARILSALRRALEGRAKLYGDSPLAHLYLVNNLNYLMKAVASWDLTWVCTGAEAFEGLSEAKKEGTRELLTVVSVVRDERRLQQHAAAFQGVALGELNLILQDSPASASSFFSRSTSFTSAFASSSNNNEDKAAVKFELHRLRRFTAAFEALLLSSQRSWVVSDPGLLAQLRNHWASLLRDRYRKLLLPHWDELTASRFYVYAPEELEKTVVEEFFAGASASTPEIN